ncbi:hypothetical protein HN592_02410 [Candidatus Woesearchaeota archaeon]|jgi:hypothetical protein|nr:hypothetical protein [Candidatus Woesearchaeota archaeon]MBT4368064.1 hypothetical protein [Candidatus Woesearchaeota archaeon]MBT4712552.1 hypothetical protein [Candidatus Woesearchaeota archaeon]MBT6639465.1 hypothetical protein [Candidatus Woesearchaeota archaeon]MBT7133637.1 hypothetical protein [Candidatus Woesearchaeota archaeon]
MYCLRKKLAIGVVGMAVAATLALYCTANKHPNPLVRRSVELNEQMGLFAPLYLKRFNSKVLEQRAAMFKEQAELSKDPKIRRAAIINRHKNVLGGMLAGGLFALSASYALNNIRLGKRPGVTPEGGEAYAGEDCGDLPPSSEPAKPQPRSETWLERNFI